MIEKKFKMFTDIIKNITFVINITNTFIIWFYTHERNIAFKCRYVFVL